MWRHLAVLTIVACGSFELDLQDNSAPITVAFEFTTSGADEASGTVMIPVILSRPADQEVTVDYTVLGGNEATIGVDFELVGGRLTFAVGESRREVAVMITDDNDETEMAESFEIALSAPTNAELDAARAIHSVRISDHILPRVTLGTGTTTSEATPTMLTVTLDKPSEGTSTVVIGVAGGAPAAAGPNDYTIADGAMVTFQNGQTTATVPIGEKEDTLDEEDPEVVVFTLRGASQNLVIGATRTLDHRITDNDNPPDVRFSNATVNLAETQPGETVTVSLSTASGRVVSVDYARDAADTAADNDATVFGSPGTLTFDPGQTTKTILIGIDNDNVDEDDETVLVNLSNAVNATITTGLHTLNIIDNDVATVSFLNSTSSVDEDNSGGISITVRLATPSSKQVMVPFTLDGGTTATAGSDFIINTASPLIFDPGMTTRTIDIDVPDNAPGNESTERVIIDLGTPTNAPRGTPARHTLSISE